MSSWFESLVPSPDATPLGVVWIGGLITSTATDIADAHAGAGSVVPACVVLLVAVTALLSFVDRLFRSRAVQASWWVFGSLTLFAVLTGAGPVSLLVGNPNRDYAAGAVYIVIAPMLAYLAVREFRWLMDARRPRRVEPAS